MAPPAVKEKHATDALPKTKPTYLPAPIEEVNAAVAQVWEDIGVWKKLAAQMNNNLAIKEHILRTCNMQGLPLIGVDIIPTQQGLKLYVNGEGAKFNRERYLEQQGRRLIERQINILPYEKVPGADAARDKQQGRIYFEIITTIEDVEQKAKIVDAVCKGTIPADKVETLLEQLKIVTKYKTQSSFSNQSEKFGDNRQPDAILKKGTTQCHRRADLEISSQCVIPEDEEPKDAEFVIKGDLAPVPSKLETAAATASEGASLPSTTLAPQKSVELPTTPAPAADAAPSADKDPAKVKVVMDEINGLFNEAGVGKSDRIKWFTENKFPISKNDMTVPLLTEALAKLKSKFKKDAPAAAAPKEDKPPADPAKVDALKTVFGAREKAGFESDEVVRAWVKGRWGKGLSEMDAVQAKLVADQVVEYANFLENHKKWGFGSELELMTYVGDSTGKALHTMTSEEVQKSTKDLGDLIS